MEKTIQIKGKNTSISLVGNPKNSPIIFLHDFFSTKEIWNSTISYLQSKFYCIAIDIPGFGSSEIPKSDDFNLLTQSQKIIFIAEFLGLNNYHIAGIGMGANIGINIAGLINPPRVEKLVLINSLPTGKFSPKFEKSIRYFDLISKSALLYKISQKYINYGIKHNTSIMKWIVYDKNNIQRNENIIRSIQINPDNSTPVRQAINAVHSADLTNTLRNIKADTLIIGGMQDQIVSIDQSYLCQTLIPKNNLAIIEKCGHFPMLEKNKNFLKALNLLLET
ncbi:MAG: alpha/beta hydrolase [Chloroflexota bacterium]